MKVVEDEDIKILLCNFENSIGAEFKKLLKAKNYRERTEAHRSLHKKGREIADQLMALTSSPNFQVRKEATKLLEEISDPESIHTLIELLNDPESEIRWIASEGLIKIGRSTIEPLLQKLMAGENLTFKLSAYNVFQHLFTKKEETDLDSLLKSLNNFMETGETASFEASNALKYFGT